MAQLNGNGLVKTVATGLATGLAGAMLALLLQSKATENQVESNTNRIIELERRAAVTETKQASDGAKLDALVTKVNDIWQVIVAKR